eukprot:m.237891 g.237891  ORF g.237891 m.237891 type:complete len:1772 (-) comp33716_c1_seq2:149-5464(-)
MSRVSMKALFVGVGIVCTLLDLSWMVSAVCTDAPAFVFLCGFATGIKCQFDSPQAGSTSEARCQSAKIGVCTEFSSEAFEEFGMTEVYLKVDTVCEGTKRTYGYQVFGRSGCQGDPFGFEIKGGGMAMNECKALSLPFIDNQIDFAFLEECSICDESSSIDLYNIQVKEEADNSPTPSPVANEEAKTYATSPEIKAFPSLDGFPFSVQPCDGVSSQVGGLAAIGYIIATGRDNIAQFDLMRRTTATKLAAKRACSSLNFGDQRVSFDIGVAVDDVYPLHLDVDLGPVPRSTINSRFVWCAQDEVMRLKRTEDRLISVFSELQCSARDLDVNTTCYQSGYWVAAASTNTIEFDLPFPEGKLSAVKIEYDVLAGVCDTPSTGTFTPAVSGFVVEFDNCKDEMRQQCGCVIRWQASCSTQLGKVSTVETSKSSGIRSFDPSGVAIINDDFQHGQSFVPSRSFKVINVANPAHALGENVQLVYTTLQMTSGVTPQPSVDDTHGNVNITIDVETNTTIITRQPWNPWTISLMEWTAGSHGRAQETTNLLVPFNLDNISLLTTINITAPPTADNLFPVALRPTLDVVSTLNGPYRTPSTLWFCEMMGTGCEVSSDQSRCMRLYVDHCQEIEDFEMPSLGSVYTGRIFTKATFNTEQMFYSMQLYSSPQCGSSSVISGLVFNQGINTCAAQAANLPAVSLFATCPNEVCEEDSMRSLCHKLNSDGVDTLLQSATAIDLEVDQTLYEIPFSNAIPASKFSSIEQTGQHRAARIILTYTPYLCTEEGKVNVTYFVNVTAPAARSTQLDCRQSDSSTAPTSVTVPFNFDTTDVKVGAIYVHVATTAASRNINTSVSVEVFSTQLDCGSLLACFSTLPETGINHVSHRVLASSIGAASSIEVSWSVERTQPNRWFQISASPTVGNGVVMTTFLSSRSCNNSVILWNVSQEHEYIVSVESKTYCEDEVSTPVKSQLFGLTTRAKSPSNFKVSLLELEFDVVRTTWTPTSNVDGYLVTYKCSSNATSNYQQHANGLLWGLHPMTRCPTEQGIPGCTLKLGGFADHSDCQLAVASFTKTTIADGSGSGTRCHAMDNGTFHGFDLQSGCFLDIGAVAISKWTTPYNFETQCQGLPAVDNLNVTILNSGAWALQWNTLPHADSYIAEAVLLNTELTTGSSIHRQRGIEELSFVFSPSSMQEQMALTFSSAIGFRVYGVKGQDCVGMPSDIVTFPIATNAHVTNFQYNHSISAPTDAVVRWNVSSFADTTIPADAATIPTRLVVVGPLDAASKFAMKFTSSSSSCLNDHRDDFECSYPCVVLDIAINPWDLQQPQQNVSLHGLVNEQFYMVYTYLTAQPSNCTEVSPREFIFVQMTQTQASISTDSGVTEPGLLGIVVAIIVCFVVINAVLIRRKRVAVRRAAAQAEEASKAANGDSQVNEAEVKALGAFKTSAVAFVCHNFGSTINPTQPSRTEIQSELETTLTMLEVARELVETHKHISDGSFGMVHVAVLYKDVSAASLSNVAVRTIDQGDTTDNASGVVPCLSEALILAKLDHPGVLKVLGVATDQYPMLIVYELMSNGNLDKWLRGQGTSNDSQSQQAITVVELLAIARQLAAAMIYLSKRQCVLRNFRAHSVLVGNNNNVKIATIGCADSEIFSRKDSSTNELARWMAPEVLKNDKYTTSSDIWAFGVVLWEIFNFGATPYEGLDDEQAYRAVIAGERLSSSIVFAEINGVTATCWQTQPNARAEFASLESAIAKLLQQLNADNATAVDDDNLLAMYGIPME